ncbi:MAG: hypothetical protein PF572_05340 [Patescibacteria group bacterium]|jgi:hypothetical protein|nr:hypothetical protein [Patescibacteria group bacterium]
MSLQNFLIYSGFAVVIYYISIVVFDFVLRGFVPFIASRPWVVNQVNDHLKKLKINNLPKFKALSLGSGRSGFFASLEERYPEAGLEGHEKGFLYFSLSWLQAFLRRSHIKVRRSRHFHRVTVSDADLIYCYAPSLETIKELGDKFKFECKPGTIILSNGFVVPFLEVKDIIELSDSKGRYSYLSKNRFLLKKNKRANKENKVYVYVV